MERFISAYAKGYERVFIGHIDDEGKFTNLDPADDRSAAVEDFTKVDDVLEMVALDGEFNRIKGIEDIDKPTLDQYWEWLLKSEIIIISVVYRATHEPGIGAYDIKIKY